MNQIQRIGLLLAVVAGVVVSSCKKEKSLENGGSGPLGPEAWEFKEGATFKGPIDTAYYSSLGGVTSLVLEGVSTDQKDDFYLEIIGANLTAGTYSTPTVVFEYYSNGTLLYNNDPVAINKFSVTITKIDASGVSGTFSGEVKDTSGNVKTITDGKFSGKFNTVPPPPSGSGQLMLWAQQGCSGTPMVVIVNGQKDTITTFQPSAPSCGTAGTAFYTLPAGDYTWKAVCAGTTDTVSGNVSVTAGSCTAKEINMNAAPGITTCKLSNLASYELGNGARISAITSFFNAQNQVTKTQLLDSSSQTTGTLENEFNFTYTASRINVDAKQYFDLEPGGRINQFHGFADPTVDTSLAVIITYTYDANGYLSKASLALDVFPTQPVFVYTYTWAGGNLTKVTIDIIGGEKSVIDYQYDLTKAAKGFLSFHTNPEILLFQNAINFGKNSANVPTKSTWTDYDDKGAVIGAPVVSNFTNYVYDINGYVKSFDITGDGSVYGSEIRHVLSYKCF
ncbi:hypothetical protein D3H65_26530 [Paraflavitalea soli]|uniref:Uncharacterized protein n=1 Tax=Paraflavitalea soli TaxID=2315862 RepID=A0A3B7N5H0_9BACT|nr:hypothetical protein [Paraflavitalea soli]AXY77321.1 hypothetical protein D3H65_26530 [Paraflavitalea soli]